MTEKIVERARLLAGEESDEDIIALCCEDAQNYIKAYCHIATLGDELLGIAAQLAVALYRRTVNEGISSITEGDRQITYAVSDAAQSFGDTLSAFVNRAGRIPSEVVRDV